MTVRTANRKRTIAAIHVLAAQLGMDTADKSTASDYRAMLFSVARASSCSALDFTGLERVRAHLAALVGRSVPRHPDPEWKWVNTAAADRQPMLRKIIMQLKSAGRAKAYADGVAAAMFKIERLELCGTRELHAIIAALNKDAQRRVAR